jgi:aminoglycoside phosphotransferase (APT) family kinase protein
MHVLTLRHEDQRSERVVLRRYVLPAESHEPDVAAREAAALEVAATIEMAAPTLLGADPTGAEAGVPSVLMSLLAGKPIWEPGNPQRWCRDLAGVLVAVHDAPVPQDGVIRSYAPHQQQSYAPPAWARDTAVWERAVEIFHEPTIDAPRRFIHRDFHPGNVLWSKRRLTGVVDWQHASIGPAVVDVGHNRLNLFFYDAALAELFTTTWEAAAEADYHQWADISAIIGGLDNLRRNPPPQRARQTIENALAAAIAAGV